MMHTRRAVIFVVSIFVLMLISFILMSQAINNSDLFNQYYFVLLILNSLGLLGLVYMIGGNIKLLLKQLKDRQPGARLTLRMVTTFITLAIVPLLIVYWFSTDFIRRGIDTWFDVRVESALTDSLNLSKESLGLRMRELLKATELIAEELADSDTRDVVIEPLTLSGLQGVINTIVMNDQEIDTSRLDTMRLRSGAEEVAVMTAKGGIIATSSANTDIIPNVPGKSTLLQLSQGRNYIGLEPIRDAGLFIRAVVKVPATNLNNKTRLVQALYPIATHINELAENVQGAYAKYQELSYLRKPLQLSFTMTLTLVLLFSIFSAVLAAFHSARKLASPIQDLAEGTRQISKGDYGKQLPLHGHDDLGFLVKSFNEMSNQIATAQSQINEQRGYLEAVLSKLSSGVMTFDADLKLKTVNQTASLILKTELDNFIGQPFKTIADSDNCLNELYENIQPDLIAHTGDWQKQIVLFGTAGRQILMCRGTALDGDAQHGHVIVFDDVTALIQGQRDAAWSEVARRLAHEIKNPLTPIQLSAERLRHKYLNKMDADEANTLDRMTNTIIQQVGTMKEMVNAFSDYARPPQIRPEQLNINPMIEEVVMLYQQVDNKIRVELTLDQALPKIEADQNRLRQILNNLIKNAIEAASDQAETQLTITTRSHSHSADRDFVEIRILDNGPGFPDDLLGEIFEPYVTTKKRGTGLGLAIVKKIVEEHGGIVWVENTKQGGAVIIRLPVVMESHNVHSINEARKHIV